MDEQHETWATGIQAEAERLTLKRLKEDKDERDRQRAEESKEQTQQNVEKKKA